MSKTEERLHDALRASASRVNDDRLRPLPSAEPALRRNQPPRNRAWRASLVPAAAAASVVLVIGLVVALTSSLHHATSQRAATGTGVTAAAAQPAYVAGLVNPFYLHTHGTAYTAVYSTATGALVAKVPNPKVSGWTITSDRVAAAPDDRTFYVEYDAVRGPVVQRTTLQIWIYRFSLTGTGSATPLTRINGGVINGCAGANDGESLILSPDGTRLVITANVNCFIIPGYADEIITVNLRSGQHAEWQGGLYRKGKILTISAVSWSADDSSLTYLALWCNPPGGINPCTGTSGTNGYRDTQVRSLDVTSGGGTLADSRLLLSQSARYPVIADAYAGPGSSDLTLLVLSGHVNAAGAWSVLTVERVSAVSGAVLQVEYRTAHLHQGEGAPDDVIINTDPSGQHLLLTYLTHTPVFGFVTGSISRGTFHLLPVKQPYAAYPASEIAAW